MEAYARIEKMYDQVDSDLLDVNYKMDKLVKVTVPTMRRQIDLLLVVDEQDDVKKVSADVDAGLPLGPMAPGTGSIGPALPPLSSSVAAPNPTLLAVTTASIVPTNTAMAPLPVLNPVSLAVTTLQHQLYRQIQHRFPRQHQLYQQIPQQQ